jgi:hypothetical protein
VVVRVFLLYNHGTILSVITLAVQLLVVHLQDISFDFNTLSTLYLNPSQIKLFAPLFVSKIIRGELQTMTEEHLQTSNLRCVSKAIYRKRRKTHPPLPKSRQETHESLAKMNIETNKFENFLHVNDEETGIIIFTCTSPRYFF